MKQGSTLIDLAAEIQRQADAKADYVADTRRLEMVAVAEQPQIAMEEVGLFGVSDYAHRQLGDRLKIPARYYDRMREDSVDLLIENVNHWLQNKPEKRMVRILDGNVRAFLSERYRPLDNFDLAEAVLPTLHEAGASVHSCEITERRMYIKAVIDGIEVAVPPPEGHSGVDVVVSPGVVVSNSEIGSGALAIQPAVHFLSCLNMATWAAHALRKYHVGKALGGDGDAEIRRFLTDETRKLSDAALWGTVRDMTRGALGGDVFNSVVSDLRSARGDDVPDPVVAVERLVNDRGLEEGEKGGVLKHLVEGGDLSRLGVSNAITRYSQDVESYDRATTLELLGGSIIALPPENWREIVSPN